MSAQAATDSVVPVEAEPQAEAVATEYCELCKEIVEVPHECRLFTAMW